jgi:membrane protein implicated in regulation of membrane protease activity
MLTTWWLWIAAAVVFAILETLAPVFVFLGLGAGAAVIGILLALGVSFGGSIAWMLVAFALFSLCATVGFRFVLGGKRDETKTFTDDING